MSEEDRRRFEGVGGYKKLARAMGLEPTRRPTYADVYPELVGKPDPKPAPLEELYGPYIVTAARADRPKEVAEAGGGIYPFGPFATETEAQLFAGKVLDNPFWELLEIPVLNKPEVFGTGDERL